MSNTSVDLVLSYEASRNQFKSGDIVFVRGTKSILHRLIMFLTSSRYVHVGIVFWIQTDDTSPKRLMIVEAQGRTNRRIVNLSFYDNRDLDVFSTITSWDQMQDTALEKIGIEKYGWITAIYVGIREFALKYFNIRLPKSNFPGEICSEFVARVVGILPAEISPGTLSKTLLSKGSKVKLMVRNG
jgi:hypothetical protein